MECELRMDHATELARQNPFPPFTCLSRGPRKAQDARGGDISQEPGVGMSVSSLEQPAMVKFML